MTPLLPNALQRTRRERRGCNRCVPRAGSLSWGRWAHGSSNSHNPMKKWLPVVMTVLVAAGCTSIHRLDGTKYQVISVPQGLRDSATLGEVAQRLTNGTPVIFKLTSGERMPLKLTVDLPMGAMERGDCRFVFKQDTYLFLSQEQCLLSPDGQRWASITTPKSLAKLFGTKHGEFRFGFSSATNGEPFMSLEIRAK
jgi:hypothetical protein